MFISREIYHAQLYLARSNLQLLVIWDLLAGQISCSTELSMKKGYNLGALRSTFLRIVEWLRRNVRGCTLWTRKAWSLFSLLACRNYVTLAIHRTPSEDSDQTARMRSLICVFAWPICIGNIIFHYVSDDTSLRIKRFYKPQRTIIMKTRQNI